MSHAALMVHDAPSDRRSGHQFMGWGGLVVPVQAWAGGSLVAHRGPKEPNGGHRGLGFGMSGAQKCDKTR